MDDRVEQAKEFLDDRWLLHTPVTRKSNRPECPSWAVEHEIDDARWDGAYLNVLIFCFPAGEGAIDLVERVYSRKGDKYGKMPDEMPDSFFEAMQEAVADKIRWGCVDE